MCFAKPSTVFCSNPRSQEMNTLPDPAQRLRITANIVTGDDLMVLKNIFFCKLYNAPTAESSLCQGKRKSSFAHFLFLPLSNQPSSGSTKREKASTVLITVNADFNPTPN